MFYRNCFDTLHDSNLRRLCGAPQDILVANTAVARPKIQSDISPTPSLNFTESKSAKFSLNLSFEAL